MTTASVKVDGFRDLERRLARLEKGVGEREITCALLAGGGLIAEEERRLVPRRTGRGAASITATASPANLPNDGTVYIGPTDDAWYLVFAEFGTVHQPIRAFVRPAVEARGEAALTLVAMNLRSEALKLTA